MKDTSGPAFPNTHSTEYIASSTAMIETTGGMTLRDYLASKAMQGLLAGADEGITAGAREVARQAYLTADCMLAERSKP